MKVRVISPYSNNTNSGFYLLHNTRITLKFAGFCINPINSASSFSPRRCGLASIGNQICKGDSVKHRGSDVVSLQRWLLYKPNEVPLKNLDFFWTSANEYFPRTFCCCFISTRKFHSEFGCKFICFGIISKNQFIEC